MSAIFWPSALPLLVDGGGDGEQPVLQNASFQSEVGLPIERPTTTLRMIDVTSVWDMNADQVAIFEDFVFDDLGKGSLDFFWRRPRTGEIVTARLTGDPKYSIAPISSIWWRVSATITAR